MAAKRAITRVWLDEQLKANGFDAVKEIVSLYRTAEDDATRVRITEIICDRLYPKARPEDAEGTAGADLEASVAFTDEQLEKITRAARSV